METDQKPLSERIEINEEEDNIDKCLLNDSTNTEGNKTKYAMYNADNIGNSSDDEIMPCEEEEQFIELNNDYEVLVDSDFGEFISSETNEIVAEKLQNESESYVDVGSQSSIPVVDSIASIPPLSKDKIALIKAAMSKITISRPNAGAAAIADHILGSHLRLGDEVMGE